MEITQNFFRDCEGELEIGWHFDIHAQYMLLPDCSLQLYIHNNTE